MKFKFWLSLGVLLLFTANVIGQHLDIKGIVYNKANEKPVEWANILAISALDSTMIEGTISDEKGNFQLSIPASIPFFIRIQAIGFQDYYLPINPDSIPSLLRVSLPPTAYQLKAVAVVAEQSFIEHQLGKKVLHIGQDIANTGGSVTDALGTIPSIEVQQEGQISLRGSSNFVLFINGKRTRRDSRSLAQIQASQVEKIEVITNPSAKYDAEGVAGIINIIYKKDQTPGWQNVIDVAIGLPARYQLGLQSSWRKSKWSGFLNFSHAQRWFDWNFRSERVSRSSEENIETYELLTTNEGNSLSYDLTGGVEWNVDSNLQLGLDFQWVPWDVWADPTQSHDFLYADGQTEQFFYTNRETEFEDEFFTRFSLKKTFGKKDHYLALQLSYSGEDEDVDNAFNLEQVQLEDSAIDLLPDLSTTDESQRYTEVQIDYQIPLSKWGLLETGLRSEYTDYKIFQQNTFNDPDRNLPDNDFGVRLWKNAFYLIQSKQLGSFEYGVGFRVESFNNESTQVNPDTTFKTERILFFPSVQLQYKFENGDVLQSIQATYSKRVQQPGFFDINPYIDFIDPLNVRFGNPFLRPEIVNAFELSYQFTLSNLSFDFTTFYRITNNTIQRTFFVAGDQTFSSLDNLGQLQNIGIEAALKFPVFSWLDLNASGTIFRRNFKNEAIDNSSWRMRVEPIFKLPKKWRLQLTAYHRSPRFGPQTVYIAQTFVNIGLQKKIANDKGTLRLGIQDLFSTRTYAQRLNNESFSLNSKYLYQTRRIVLGLQWKLNGN